MATSKDKEKSALFISFDGLTDPLGRSQVIPYLVGLSKAGYKMTVLSTEKHAAFEQQSAVVSAILKEANIEWEYVWYRNKLPVVSPILMKYELQSKADKIYAKSPFSIVHGRSYFASMIALELKRKFGVKFVFDMRGFWADERKEGGIWRMSNPVHKSIYNYFKKKEKDYLENADQIVSLTHNGKGVLTDRKDLINRSPITVIPCCVNTQHFSKENINQEKLSAFKKELNINDDDWVITYLGSIGTWYMLEEMLDFFKVLQSKKPNAKFLFISKEEDLLRSKAKNVGISMDSIIVKPVVYDDVPTLLSLSNVSIFFIKPVFSKRASSPVKQGEIMALGIPIICNTNVGDTDFVINKYNCGALVNDFNDQAYGETINSLDQIEGIAEVQGRKGAMEFYGLEQGVADFVHVYDQCINNK